MKCFWCKINVKWEIKYTINHHRTINHYCSICSRHVWN